VRLEAERKFLISNLMKNMRTETVLLDPSQSFIDHVNAVVEMLI